MLAVSGTMQSLFDSGEYNIAFQPKQIDHAMGQYTCGFWQVQCSLWDPAVVTECWGRLCQYVASGEAGCGVRCLLTDKGSTIELHCYSAILRYMYLLLHLVSGARVEGCKLLWFDYVGRVRVEM